uniref:DAO domain-containing protein n=1 Tax=Rhabditophanes sp. KR3021 TaxID=114890 RepID=A0AC35TR75_9BILA
MLLSRSAFGHLRRPQCLVEHVRMYSSDPPIIIGGGGIAGLSVAYHLTELGKKVVVYDKNSIGANNASVINHGMISSPYFWQNKSLMRLAQKSHDFYEHLAKSETFAYDRCGKVFLATNEKMAWELRRMEAYAKGHGYKGVELVDCPSEMIERWPMIHSEDVILALYSPHDTRIDMVSALLELAKNLREKGVKIFENSEIKDVCIGENRTIYGCMTDSGLIETEIFVDCAGINAGRIPVKALAHEHVLVASYPCSVNALTTDKLICKGVSDNSPVICDVEKNVFLKVDKYETWCGGFVEEVMEPLANAKTGGEGNWTVPVADWDKFYPILSRLVERFPSLANSSHGNLALHYDMFTPDKSPIIGESSEVNGYFISTGFNARGLSLAPGVGEVLAKWICKKPIDIDVASIDVTRFLSMHANSKYLFQRVPEVASYVYDSTRQSYQYNSARNLRMSPIYHQLKDAGAVFGELMGYERPLWFEEPGKNNHHLYCGQDPLIGKPEWFPHVLKEYEACRERVGLIDMTSFSKFEIKGNDAEKFLQYLCSGNVNMPIGETVYTGMQNEKGGYVTDCTISRLKDNHYFVVAPTVQQLRCYVWLKQWARKMKSNVKITDVTGNYTALDLIGPSSRYLMQDISGEDMSANAFPVFHCKEISIGMGTNIRAVSISHCGELGWVLYIPNEFAGTVYDAIIKSGKEYNLRHCGYYTMRYLRIEKFYVYWGQDINERVTPVECGRAFRVEFKKPQFIGREALVKQMEEGVSKKFVQVFVQNHDMDTDPWPQGGEPIYRNGVPVGWTTSAAYAITLGKQVCLAYIENKEQTLTKSFINQGDYVIDINGRKFKVKVSLHSPNLPMISSEHPNHYVPTRT